MEFLAILEHIINFIARLDFSSILIFVMIVIIMGVIYGLNNSKETKFEVVDLVVDPETGKGSTTKIALIIALIVSSWGFIHLAIKDLLTEWYFFGYMSIWVLNRGFTKWLEFKENTEK